MKLSILYDNKAFAQGMMSDWGFSCLIETKKANILFDTGAEGRILLQNMNMMGIDPSCVDMVFISHGHWDHTGGLRDFLSLRNVPVLLPASASPRRSVPGIEVIRDAVELFPGIYTTGELGGIEQSLILETRRGLLVVVGCSHPGVGKILRAASAYGKVGHLVGGLHAFDEFPLLDPLESVCPIHCTQHRREIRLRYPDKWVEGGVGRILQFEDPE